MENMSSVRAISYEEKELGYEMTVWIEADNHNGKSLSVEQMKIVR